VQHHLNKCKDNFIPALHETVDIAEYSKKIVENAVTFEAWIQDELVGLVAAYLNDRENRTGFISNVSVLKEYAGKGIASQLINNCIEFARENKFREILLEVNGNNLQAVKLYEKYHFTQQDSKAGLKIMSLHL
jgi:ribosomal protein S18 acetylase RimI-like enzyme